MPLSLCSTKAIVVITIDRQPFKPYLFLHKPTFYLDSIIALWLVVVWRLIIQEKKLPVKSMIGSYR